MIIVDRKRIIGKTLLWRITSSILKDLFHFVLGKSMTNN
jgi:hypothetical protein